MLVNELRHDERRKLAGFGSRHRAAAGLEYAGLPWHGAAVRGATTDKAKRALSDGAPSPVDGDADESIPVEEYDHGPARGIVLGLVPALLVWAVPIAFVVKLLD